MGDPWHYDAKCPYCGHDWHGLPCAGQIQFKFVTCACPTSFRERETNG